MNPITQIIQWQKDAGQISHGRCRPYAASLYAGLVVEEVSEMLEALSFEMETPLDLQAISMSLRQGGAEIEVKRASPEQRQELLDAALDIIVVATGLAASLGADVEGALADVIRSNDSKRNPDGTLSLDHTGKVVKGRNYTPPNLAPYLPQEAS